MTWFSFSARRAASVLATLVIGALVAFVLLSRGAATGPSTTAQGEGVAARSGFGVGEPVPSEPLVTRMLEGLQAGRSARSFDNPTLGADIPVVKTASDVPVGRLRIPRMELRTTFFEGVHDAVINKGPGHWPGTPLPGQAGNSVFSGHRATHGAEFVDLDDLRPGDPIFAHVGGRNQPYRYEVQGTTIVPQSRYVRYVTRQPQNPRARVLTLFACDPVWDHTHRIVVRAELTGAGPARAG